MKWRLVVFNKGCSAALECYDAGVLSENKVKSYCDNYSYVGGSLRFDGIEVHLSQKCSAVNAYGAIPIQLEDEVALRATLPDKVPVVDFDERKKTDNRSERPSVKPPTMVKVSEISIYFPSVHLFVSDPRVLFLAYAVALDEDEGLWRRLSHPLPSRQRALKILTEWKLWTPFNPRLEAHDAFYDNYHHFLEGMQLKYYTEVGEIVKRVEKTTPEVTTKRVRVAGTFAIPDKSVLRELEENYPVHLVREPKNQYDKNAIRVKYKRGEWVAPHMVGEKLGYIPKELAKEVATWMDAGHDVHAVIAENGVKGEKIDLEMILRKGVSDVDNITIHWWRSTGEWCQATIDVAKQQLRYHRRKNYLSGETLEVKLKFSKQNWEYFVLPHLKTCAFTSWNLVYRAIDIEYKNFVWQMVAHEDGIAHRSCGCNAAPIEWGCWEALIHNCLDLNTTLGTGSYVISK